MSWTRPSIQTIYDRIKADMESKVTSGVKIPRVSLLGILGMVFAGSAHLTYGFLEWIKNQIFVDTADEYGLLRWGNVFGLPRKAAQYAQENVAFTGTATTVVPSGTKVVTSEGYEYETQAAFTIGTTVSVQADALAAGDAYNSDDTTWELSSPIANVDNVVQRVSTVQAGTDIETVEAWVDRLLQRFRNPPSSGSASDYIRWALEVDGVGRAWCYPAEIWGQGTLGVYVATDELEAVSAAVLADVQTYIDSVRPVPAYVDYLNVVPRATQYGMKLDPNTADMRSAINTELRNLHTASANPGGTLLLSHIRQAISLAGPYDYELVNISVDTYGDLGVVDVTVDHPDLAVFGSGLYADF